MTTLLDHSKNSTQTQACFQLKGAAFTLPTLRLYSLDDERLAHELEEKIQQAPNFFREAPIVLDLQPLSQFKDLIKLDQIAKVIQQKGLILVGIRGANAALQQAARTAGLAILPETKAERPQPVHEKTQEKESITGNTNDAINTADTADAGDTQLTPTKLVTQPIRSGQQVYAPGGDLVVLAAVSHGAELLADGHIHVYGPLRGRALAGINGDKNAIIYCQSLEAELISIAGQYRLSEDYKDTIWKTASLIQLVDERLKISPI